MTGGEDDYGYVLHNLVTGEDFFGLSEAEALQGTRSFAETEDWSLWKVRKDNSGEPVMLGVGVGPIT